MNQRANQELFETDAAATPAPLSLREYARQSGRAFNSVQRAVRVGILSASVVRDHRGAPKIVSKDAADHEFAAFRKHDHVPLAHRRGAERPAALPGLSPRDVSKARREQADAEFAELRLKRARGEFVSSAAVSQAWGVQFVVIRNRLLGVPFHLRRRRPDLDKDTVHLVDDLIREALTELSEMEPHARQNADTATSEAPGEGAAAADEEEAEAGVDEAADHAAPKKPGEPGR